MRCCRQPVNGRNSLCTMTPVPLNPVSSVSFNTPASHPHRRIQYHRLYHGGPILSGQPVFGIVPTRPCGASLWSRVATDPYDRRKGQNRKVSSNTSEGQWRENVRGRGNAGNAAGSRGNPSSERGLPGYCTCYLYIPTVLKSQPSCGESVGTHGE